ncbi:MAG TPA: glycosyltransferase family 2 protein [Stellaceae bacterium]|nr:glycosyltransferase family 2 protein [Stellaceae bacterium]
MSDESAVPFLSVVLPALDEEHYLEPCLRSLLADPYPRDRLEVFIVDGGSSDRTVAIAHRLAGEFPFLRVLHNPNRLQAAGFNLALRAADPRAEYVMRCDVHAEYPPGFLTRAAAALARSGAAVATYGDAPKAKTCFQTAVAFAQNTPLGVGNAWYRLGGVSRFVEHGKHGCFRRAAIEAVGGYDEAFSHNEDSELSLRLIKAGGKVWLDADLTVYYYPRATPAALARQYFRYGRGRAQTVLKHRIMPRARQLAPVALVIGDAACLALAPLASWLLLPILAYLLALVGAALYGALRYRRSALLLSAIAFAVMHHAWGLGFLSRLLQAAAPPSGDRPSLASPSAP